MTLQTNLEIAKDLQDQWPHTFSALQKLLVAIDDFTRDRGAPNSALNDPLFAVLVALQEDGFVDEGAEVAEYRARLEYALSKFALAFPNWQDCYSFIATWLKSGHAEAHMAELLYGGGGPGDE